MAIVLANCLTAVFSLPSLITLALVHVDTLSVSGAVSGSSCADRLQAIRSGPTLVTAAYVGRSTLTMLLTARSTNGGLTQRPGPSFEAGTLVGELRREVGLLVGPSDVRWVAVSDGLRKPVRGDVSLSSLSNLEAVSGDVRRWGTRICINWSSRNHIIVGSSQRDLDKRSRSC